MIVSQLKDKYILHDRDMFTFLRKYPILHTIDLCPLRNLNDFTFPWKLNICQDKFIKITDEETIPHLYLFSIFFLNTSCD